MVGKIINQKGITMAMLIVTIIIMLILAGVSINVIVNDDFFGRAEDMNKMNNQAINTAHKAEEDALKQNIEDFKVDSENIKVDKIEAYEYVENEEVELADKRIVTISRLKVIDYSLSKYIDEHLKPNESVTIYFKANSNIQELTYWINGVEQEKLYEFYEDRDDGAENIVIASTKPVGNEYIKGNTILSFELSSKNDLDSLEIEAKSGSDIKQKLVFDFEKSTKSFYIPTYTKSVITPNYETNKVLIKWDGVVNGSSELNDLIEGADVSTKTDITDIIKTNVEKNKNNIFISEFTKSTIQENLDPILYLVQEKEEKEAEYSKYIIDMEDYSFEFYNPIVKVELEKPKILQYVTDKSKIIPKYTGYNGTIPDIQTTQININTENTDKTEFELENLNSKIVEANLIDELGKKKFKLVNDEISSTINHSELGELLEVLGKNTLIQDTIPIEIIATDYGGKTEKANDNITVAVGNFMIFAITDESFNSISQNANPTIELEANIEIADELNGVAVTTDSNDKITGGAALEIAKYYFNEKGYKNVVIKQMISDYSIEIYREEEIKNQSNDVVEKHYYLDIEVPQDKKLIYDINGNTLQFKERARLVIGENSDFTLMSSLKKVTDKYGNEYHDNGALTFSHGNTFTGKVDIKTYSLEDFIKVEKYRHLKSLKSFIASMGKETTGVRYLLNRIQYRPLYMTRLMNSYKEYINSFNNIGLQNKDYKHDMEAIINNGTFNFHSGRIELVTDETVTAIGGFGGGIFINVADSFLKILEQFGIEVPSLTDYAASFAKLENTAVGVKNFGNVVLGTGEGASSELDPYPEVAILVDSAVNGIGLSVGSLTNPNRVVSRAYGVWNAGEDKNNDGNTEYGITTMNSGFIQMGITNNTNNWVSLNVGRTYGIFNDYGTTYLNGFTKVSVTRDISLYGLITRKLLEEKNTETDSQIKNALNELYNNFTFEIKKVINAVQTKKFDGFFSYSELQVLYKLTGGGTTCYTNSYAVANAEGRRVYKNEGNYNKELGDADGIIIGEKFGLVEKEFEGTVNNIFNKSENTNYKLKVPGYYVLYEDNNENNEYNPGPNGPDRDHDFHDNAFQKISNPINHYLDFDTIVGSAFSSGINGINNLLNTSWIGEDFKDENIIYNLIKLTVKGATNWAEDIITGIKEKN